MTQQAPGYPVYATAPRTNGLAIAAFVLGLCGFALLPVILGHVALRQIRDRGDAGSAFAIIGLVLGYLELVGLVIFGFVVIGGVGAAVFFGNQ